MLSFNPDEYRQRLNSALGIRDTTSIGLRSAARAPAVIENPYDTGEAPQQPQEQKPKQQGGMNLGSMMQQAMGGMGGGGGMPGMSGGGMPGMGGEGESEGGGGGFDIGSLMGGGGGEQGESSGGMPNLGGMMGGGGGESGSGEIPGMISEMGAMGGSQKQSEGSGLPFGEDGKIQTRPPDMQAEADPEKLDKAKTIDEVFDAAPSKQQNEYMDWWEKSYGSINSKYDRMRDELGQYKKFPEKPSKKQMFVYLLGYGARMMNNMRGGVESGVDPMAASMDASGFAQDTAMGNRMSEGDYNANLSAIEGARARELKGLGSRGDAINRVSEINLRDAQAENYRRPKDEKAEGERFTAADGLVYIVGKDANAKPVMVNGKQLRGPVGEKGGDKSEFDRAKQSYIEAHGYDANGKKLSGKDWQKVLRDANDFARYGTREKDVGDETTNLRAYARERVNTLARSSPDLFRGMEPDEVTAEMGKMEEQEYQRLLRTNLGSSPTGRGQGPRAAAPERSVSYVKEHPEALEDFVNDYGYVPEGMEQHVTPAIKKRLRL